jgi:hypothetical protein
MNETISSYLRELELITFFAGYPLFYVLISAISERPLIKNLSKARIISLLPYSYALIATLYLGLQLNTYFAGTTNEQLQIPIIVIWALLAILFWIPLLAKRPVLSLLHSLMFLVPIVRDIFLLVTRSTENDILRNDMKLYTISLVIHFAAFMAVSLFCFLYRSIRMKD